MMLPNLPPETLYAIAAAACVALATAGALALAARRAREARLATQSISAQIAELAAELAALRSTNGSQGATLLALAARFDGLQRDIASDARHAAAPAASGGGSSAFELAIRLARGGGSVEELMSACLVTRHEAELALRLHGPQSRAGATRLAAVR